MDESIYYFLLYYFSGIFTYGLIRSVFTKYEESMSYRRMEISILEVYRALDFDIRSSMKLKYKNLKDAGVDHEEMEKVAKLDQATLTIWRESAIKKVMLETPRSIVRFNNYRTWNEAMNVLRKEKRK